MKKKVLIINKMYSPDIGGVETVVKQYAEYLNDYYDVTVLIASSKFSLKTTVEQINNINVVRCSSFGTFLSMPVSISFLFKFFIMSRHCDFIHFHEPFPLATICSLYPKRSKYLVTWHSDIVKQKIFKSFVGFFQKKLCSKADAVLTTSPRLAADSEIISLFPSKVEVIPLSIDNEKYLNSSSSIGDYLLYIGRLSYYKGILNLMDAFELSNSKYPLYIVGDGDRNLIKEIKEKCSVSKKQIYFINKYVSETEKLEYLKNCRALMFPSTHKSEAFGIVQLEAMIFNKPVINTNLPTGVPWVSVDKKTGLTVTPGSIVELCEAIEKLNSDALVETYGNNARERVLELFLDNVVLNKLRQVYERIS